MPAFIKPILESDERRRPNRLATIGG